MLEVQISMWTAGIVVMTLLVNAPLIPLLLKWTGLSQVSKVKAKIRAKAARAFTRYTENAVEELKNDEDEMLRGKLAEAVSHSKCKQHAPIYTQHGRSTALTYKLMILETYHNVERTCLPVHISTHTNVYPCMCLPT